MYSEGKLCGNRYDSAILSFMYFRLGHEKLGSVSWENFIEPSVHEIQYLCFTKIKKAFLWFLYFTKKDNCCSMLSVP